MKRTYLIVALLMVNFIALGQPTTGLIAHWDMNGTPNDVSGNGHNGTPNNLTSAVGEDGVSGHAWYFNGSNSSIIVPYSPAFNVSAYSISADVKVMGFYTGPCTTNMIFVRGKTSLGNCVYDMVFNSQPQGTGCTSYDTTKEVFWSGSSAPTATLSPYTVTSCNYTPYIIENQWYHVVVTFNDTMYQTFVNGVLVDTAYIENAGLPLGTGTQGISIGYNANEPSYPYPFKGVIDDIKLYNRVLSDSEVVHINDTCGTITSQPVTTGPSASGVAHYTVASSIVSATYQWQQNSGTGFVNLSNAGPYSGVYTPTLTITGVTGAMDLYAYRCLVSNSWGCADTTTSATLTLGVNSVISTQAVTISPNPAKNKVSVQLPFMSTIANITLMNEIGQLINERQTTSKSTDIDLSDLAPGMYIIKVEYEGQAMYKKVIKY